MDLIPAGKFTLTKQAFRNNGSPLLQMLLQQKMLMCWYNMNETAKIKTSIPVVSTLHCDYTEVMTSQKTFFEFQRFEYHISVEHVEKPLQPKFGGNRFMGARDMTA